MTWESWLVGWAVFNVLVYGYMLYEDLYYSHNLSKKFKKMRETLTEE